MPKTIHNGPAYKVEANVQDHGATGATLTVTTTYPTARKPEPHTLVRLTLPRESLHRLGQTIAEETKDEKVLPNAVAGATL